MKKKLNSILLVDDSAVDNRYHQIVLRKTGVVENIKFAENGLEALNLLKNEKDPPELIFLDINMPKVNGWEFLEAYKGLSIEQKSRAIIIMLTTSLNPEDRQKAEAIPEVTDFIVKPLTPELIEEIIAKYFPDYL